MEQGDEKLNPREKWENCPEPGVHKGLCKQEHLIFHFKLCIVMHYNHPNSLFLASPCLRAMVKIKEKLLCSLLESIKKS